MWILFFLEPFQPCLEFWVNLIAKSLQELSFFFSKGLEELKKSRIQKNASETLISKVEEGGEKSEEFLNLLSDLSGIENPTADDILPIMLLLQLDYYSKESSEFQTFAVFIEKDNAPDYIVIMDSNPKQKIFLTPENVKVLKESKIAPKITASDRVEIYMFNKKQKQKNEAN